MRWGLPYNAPMIGAKLVFPGPNMGDRRTSLDLMNERAGDRGGRRARRSGQLLLNHLRQTGTKLETLTRTVIGGSAVPLSMIQAFDDEHGVTVVQGWGMTEMSPLGTVSTLRPDQESLPLAEQLPAACAAGHGIFGVAMKVVDEDGQRAAVGRQVVG